MFDKIIDIIVKTRLTPEQIEAGKQRKAGLFVPTKIAVPAVTAGFIFRERPIVAIDIGGMK